MPAIARRLTLESLRWSAHQLVMRFGLGELSFSTVYWYPDVDLLDLDRRFGRDFMERVHLHSALFESNKLASLRPEILDLGPYARHHTAALERLWCEVFQRIWAQWRYENDLPDASPPQWATRPVASGLGAVRRDRHADEVLLFCGGGKDSLVTMKLLERAGIPFASFGYATNAYGLVRPQLGLIDALLDHGVPRRRERQIVFDDFVDAPVLSLYGESIGVRTITTAETPSSVFGSLPILLARGYPLAALGHEASANRGNLVWDRTGEEVNHQWGKSVEAERLLDEYVRSELVADIGVFSLLMPIHDVVIFSLLRRDASALRATHSCNEDKPWCRRCPKCAYVWLGYRAHLERAPVEAMFPEDLLEVHENQPIVRDLLGLGSHLPFECVGHVEESRLALALCRARGLLGPGGLTLAERLPPLELSAMLERYLRVDAEHSRLPASIAAGVLPQMREAAEEARTRILAQLGRERTP
ncbi:hypothetical protein [Paraliomyxa miuraensis]|uniref:hypothetical protein n=1 Tax=Paraliomyxa miuraensis TaxID=376150 RepID=UPI002258C4C1|nr:hypothetical protein [Paraliomyxa miuraensis]MCX4240400.1 hypothetical protein [Paraliomyxa miuraensis]